MDHYQISLVLAVICGVIGYSIGAPKNRPVAGFLWGFFMGFIGLIVAKYLRPKPYDS